MSAPLPFTPSDHLWFNGRLVPWAQATVHVMTHALHYGSSVFEGIRCYATDGGPVFFRATPHLERLLESARIYRMPVPFGVRELLDACALVVRRNDLADAYLRPLVWRGCGGLGLTALDGPIETMIAGFRQGAPHAGAGGGTRDEGIDVGVSSWTRVAPNTLPVMAKAGGNYLSTQLIASEARRHGYDEGIALDTQGYVSEGSGSNIFVVRDGVLLTPPLAAGILPGITRDAVITLARWLGYEVREEWLPRELLYVASEVLLCGTASEIVAVRSVDGMPVANGAPGTVTLAIQRAFRGLFTGDTPDHWGWLERVGAPAVALMS